MNNSILIVDCGSSKVPLIESTLTEFNQDFTTIQMNSVTAELALSHQGIIVSGAPILLTKTDPGPFLDQIRFLLDYPLPVLGICFGHQLLGMLHGARAFKCESIRSNLIVEKQAESILFQDITDYTFNQDHCEAIDLPKGWKHLASSSICLNEAMEHPSKSLYGVQFHPETSNKNGAQLLKNFCKSCSTS